MPKEVKESTKTSSVGKTLNKCGAPIRNQRGFTLLEMILVIILMALIAGVSLPFMGSTLDRISLQSTAREIASALRFARSQAITLKTLFTFNGDLTNNRYWLTNPRADTSTKTKTVDETVRLAQFQNADDIQSDGTFIIRFYPRGNSSGGSIRLEQANEENSETYYVIKIDPITGSPKIEAETQ